jgi:uroporphyrinogen decarboxylase
MFESDYRNIVDAAMNIAPKRIPVYEHIIDPAIMERVLGVQFADLLQGDNADKAEFFRQYCRFFQAMGYDTVSFEQCVTKVLPGAGALYKHTEPVIKTGEDLKKYPFDAIPDLYEQAFFSDFDALREAMPPGMKAIGGIGNGLFEMAQDLAGYQELCYIMADDDDMFSALFDRVGELMMEIWRRFLPRYGNVFCVMRFGDDLGFKSQTLLSAETIRRVIIPWYQKVVALIHSANKPFLLHSCGSIFDIMPDLIDVAGIDAKHSNEDSIAPFCTWVERYGDRIGNFGGVDADVLCSAAPEQIKQYVTEVYNRCAGRGGIALGSGNSIPDYIPVEGYVAMVEAVRSLRGE